MVVAKHCHMYISVVNPPGADPGIFLGGGVLVSCSTSTPTNHNTVTINLASDMNTDNDRTVQSE